MVRAEIQWKDGTESSIIAKDMFDLATRIGDQEYLTLEAKEIKLDDMRQGKDNGKKVRKNAQPV